MYIYFAKSKYFNLNVSQTSHSQVYCMVLLTANGAIDHSHESHDFFFIDACTTSFKNARWVNSYIWHNCFRKNSLPFVRDSPKST